MYGEKVVSIVRNYNDEKVRTPVPSDRIFLFSYFECRGDDKQKWKKGLIRHRQPNN